MAHRYCRQRIQSTGRQRSREALASRWSDVAYLRLPEKGRGRALRRAWLESSADAVCYMDVDLSTDLKHLVPLVRPLLEGRCHVAIGSRLMPESEVVNRTPLREFTSRVYNLLIALMFPGRSFVDAQCGFKALSRQGVERTSAASGRQCLVL